MKVSSRAERQLILNIDARCVELAIIVRQAGEEARMELMRPVRVETRRVGVGRARWLHQVVIDDQVRIVNNNNIYGLAHQILVRIWRLKRELGPLAFMALKRNTRARRLEFVRLLSAARQSRREIETIYNVFRQSIGLAGRPANI